MFNPFWCTDRALADLLVQVRNFKEDCIVSHHDFISVLEQLKSVADASLCLPLTCVNDLKRLTDIWDGHCGTYIQIIWRSRYVAERAEEFGRKFTGQPSNLPDDTHAILQGGRIDINAYRAAVDRDQTSSQEIMEDLIKLNEDVNQFSHDWEEIFLRITPVHGQEDTPWLSKVGMALKWVRSKISQICRVIERLANTTVYRKVDAVYHTLEDQDIDEISFTEKTNQDITCVPQSDAFQNVSTQLAAVTSIWDSISVQLSEVSNFMELAAQTPTQKAIGSTSSPRLTQIRTRHSDLVEIFREYQIAVSNRAPTSCKR
ncbi:unnamed protein product [Somion occarium]|uniref:Uncharacterized protein n=1 Tax=Somion occarium TaxID=3059160 RepID=A0ABP1E8W7_9APHY